MSQLTAAEILSRYSVIEAPLAPETSSEPAPVVTGAWRVDGEDSLPLGPTLGLGQSAEGYTLYLECDGGIEPVAGDLLRLELNGRQTLFLPAGEIRHRVLGSPNLNGLEIRAEKAYLLRDPDLAPQPSTSASSL